MGISTKQIDWLNVALIFLSMGLAIWLPFQLFLFSYAVLGPLHYLTEINWLDKKNYFSNRRTPFLIWMIFLGVLFTATPVLIWLASTFQIESIMDFFRSREGITTVKEGAPIIVLVALVSGVGFALIKNRVWLIFLIACSIAFGLYFRQANWQILYFGSMTPTIIHVFIFTWLFMIFGALKSKSAPGIISSISLIVAAVVILLIPFGSELPTEDVMQVYRRSTFDQVSSDLLKVFSVDLFNNLGDAPIRNKVQAFVAFAYTYHYLNWFSKTSIIKWHQVSKKKLIATVIVWMISVGLYYYDYRTGLTFLFFLSILHVFVEFPLNVASIKGIAQELKNGISLKWK